jgi:hypothetical protein
LFTDRPAENEYDNPADIDPGAKSGMPRRLGWVAGIICFCVSCVAGVYSIVNSRSSTAAVGFIFVPFAAAIISIPAFAAGWCWGYFLDWHRSRIGKRRILAITAGLFTVMVGIWTLKIVWDGLNLSQQVYGIQTMSATALEDVLNRPKLVGNKFILGAVAQNPNATAAILHRIAVLDRPDLYERMGSVFDVLGNNPSGLAVMRLIARHPNTASDDLEKLAASKNEYVRGDVAANPKLSEATLRSLATDGDYRIEWGLALNRRAPGDLLSGLGRSGNEYTRTWVAANPNTPPETLAALGESGLLQVRLNVARNHSTPRSTIEMLVGDADANVRAEALAGIHRP